jgi:hypothetical protein
MEPAITRADFAELMGHSRQWAYQHNRLPPLTQRGSKRVITLADAQAWLEARIARYEARIDTLKAAHAQVRADRAIAHYQTGYEPPPPWETAA